MSSNLVIIFGYNNTRVYDIERLKKMCRELLGAEIMLCKESITQIDLDITPYTLEVDLTKYDIENIQYQMKQIDDYIAWNNFKVVACLPFSDKGIPLGSYYARSKELMHDDCEKSLACIDKFEFRLLEKETKTPVWYKKPFFNKIHTITEARDCINSSELSLFFKPVAEGNSRGCIEINSMEDLEENIEIIKIYLPQGILVEECIKGCDEYSFDGVDDNYIITEKKTSQGFYRVETQHIIPAPLETELYGRLIEAGKIVSKISGSNRGAVHNELFLNKKTGDVYCVEPNRRPAGLKLWDWISTAYPGADNWSAWLNWAAGRSDKNKIKIIDHKYYVGCRMLQAPLTGTVQAINNNIKSKIQAIDGVYDIAVTKKEGQTVTNNLKDNGDFTGYIVCKSDTAKGLVNMLDLLEKESAKIYTIG